VLRLLYATRNSWNGLVAAARTEKAVQQELWLLLVAIPLAFIVASDTWRRVALIGVILLLIVVELLNTAVEKLSDHVTPDSHPVIGRVKDMGSAAVGLSLLLAGLVWLAALGERLGLLQRLPVSLIARRAESSFVAGLFAPKMRVVSRSALGTPNELQTGTVVAFVLH
jgi:diacylglycerol kinase (ATP)